MGDRWSPEGPPEDAYSRATNVERFLPLHDAAQALLKELAETYDATLDEAPELDRDPDLNWFDEPSPRPATKLVPVSPQSATLGVVFTPFPGITMRFGHRHVRVFPSCGCDACDETADEEIEHMRREVHEWIASRYSEEIRLSDDEVIETLVFRRPTGGGSRTEGELYGEEAKRALKAGVVDAHWEPWTRRRS